MTNKIHIFFHSSDLDGYSSAAIAYYALKKTGLNIKFHPINYGVPFPYDEIEFVDEVYMLDFSMESPDDMRKINQSCEFTWIDHHITAIEKIEKENLNIKGIREVGKAGCELTWQYFFGTQPPFVIRLLGRYDVWDLTYNDELINSEDLIPFQYGMKSLELEPYDKFWNVLFDENMGISYTQDIVKKGINLHCYQKTINKMICEMTSSELVFHGYKAISANSPIANSQLFDGFYNKDKHDIMIVYIWSAKIGQWKVSLYTDHDDIDVSELAKLYGGGGHKKAAGFQTGSVAEFTKKRR